MTTTEIEALVASGKANFEGIPRNQLAWALADALVAQQAVVEAAKWMKKMGMPLPVRLVDALAALKARKA